MKTFEDFILFYSRKLKAQKINRPKRIVEEIVSNLINVERCSIFEYYEKKIEASLQKKLKKKIARIAQNEPVEYVLGYVKFYNCHIKVNSSVLIPRQETELLMDSFVKLSHKNIENKNIFDICCGSGCLAIAAKKKFPSANVYASDVSEPALKIASENSVYNNVDVNFMKGSLFQPYNNLKADYILCNPPYLSKKEYDEINNLAEPSIALIGGETGFEFYEKIANDIMDYVNPKAKLFFEIGFSQGKILNKIFEKLPFRRSEILKDLAGHDRFFFLEIE